MTRTWV